MRIHRCTPAVLSRPSAPQQRWLAMRRTERAVPRYLRQRPRRRPPAATAADPTTPRSRRWTPLTPGQATATGTSPRPAHGPPVTSFWEHVLPERRRPPRAAGSRGIPVFLAVEISSGSRPTTSTTTTGTVPTGPSPSDHLPRPPGADPPGKRRRPSDPKTRRPRQAHLQRHPHTRYAPLTGRPQSLNILPVNPLYW